MEAREALKPVEAVGNAIAKLGKIMLNPFLGGWANLGRSIDEPATPANITYYVEDPQEREADL